MYLRKLNYFKYNRPERGWAMMNNIYEDARRNYPEISFVLVQNCIAGIMGVDAFAPQNLVMTTPELPGEINWVEVDSLKIGGQYVDLKHEKNYKTTLTNKSDNPMNWNAGFYGYYSSLLYNGEIVPAAQTFLNGCERSFIETTVNPGETAVVEVDTTTISVDEQAPEQKLRLLPNPAGERFFVEASVKVHYLEIFDLTGVLIKRIVADKDVFAVDVSNFVPGVYLLKFGTGEGISAKRIIIR